MKNNIFSIHKSERLFENRIFSSFWTLFFRNFEYMKRCSENVSMEIAIKGIYFFTGFGGGFVLIVLQRMNIVYLS